MTVIADPLLLEQLTMLISRWVLPTYELSDNGHNAVSAQLAAAMANCQRFNLLAPPGCPVHLKPDGLAEGTVAWGLPI